MSSVARAILVPARILFSLRIAGAWATGSSEAWPIKAPMRRIRSEVAAHSIVWLTPSKIDVGTSDSQRLGRFEIQDDSTWWAARPEDWRDFRRGGSGRHRSPAGNKWRAGSHHNSRARRRRNTRSNRTSTGVFAQWRIRPLRPDAPWSRLPGKPAWRPRAQLPPWRAHCPIPAHRRTERRPVRYPAFAPPVEWRSIPSARQDDRVRQHSEPAQFRKHILEQIDPLCGEVERKERTAGEIAARPRRPDRDRSPRIAADGTREHRSPPASREWQDRSTRRVHVAPCQLGQDRTERVRIAGRIAQLQNDVFSLDVPALAQSFAKSINERVGLRFGRNPEDADEVWLFAPVWRMATQPPRRRAA